MTNKQRNLWIFGLVGVLGILLIVLLPGSGILSNLTQSTGTTLLSSRFSSNESWTGTSLAMVPFETGSGVTLTWQSPIAVDNTTDYISIKGDISSIPNDIVRIELVDQTGTPVMRKVIPMLGAFSLDHDFSLESILTMEKRLLYLRLIFPADTEINPGFLEVSASNS